jgi:F0F1-type ATP synthase assembly protein I
MARDVVPMSEDRPNREKDFYAALGKLSAIITIVPASMAGGWVMGHYLLDRYLGTGPWGGIACLILGAGAGFYEITKLLMTKTDRDTKESPPNDNH